MNLSKICRLCCEEKPKMRSILEDGEANSLGEIFSGILMIEIYSDDGLPQKACEQCIKTLKELNQIVGTFRQNDFRLRQQLLKTGSVKEEVCNMQIEILEESMLTDGEKFSEEEENADEVLQEAIEFIHGDTNADEELVERLEPLENSAEKTTERKPVAARRTKKTMKDLHPMRKRRRGLNKHLTCYICSSGDPFPSAEALFNHLHMLHEHEVPYTCPICELETVVLTNVTALNAHKRMHEMPEKCSQCDKRFISRAGVDEHIKRAHDVSEVPLECPECGKTFATKVSLESHIYRHNNKIFCHICGKKFSSKTKVNFHITQKHSSDVEKLECQVCHKLLKTKDSLATHMLIMHSNTEPNRCPYCPKSYVSKTSLQYHIKKHEANPDRPPSIDLKRYYKVVAGDEALHYNLQRKECTICGKVARNISAHLYAVHFPREYPCTECDEVFKLRKSLEVHLFEHREGKILKCPICDREFRNRKNLVAHLQTKKHRDHPQAKSLEWLDALYPEKTAKGSTGK